MKRFIIRLREPHLKTGLSAYMVAKKLGLNEGTVRKYVTGEVIAEILPAHVLQLCDFYGVDWRDPAVVEEVTIEGDDSSGQIKTLLTPA